MRKIMIIRHAEKHQNGSQGLGVTEEGRPSAHELTVRGWQRAAALVQFFAPEGAAHKSPAIETPRSIFASDATKHSPSLRAMHTAGLLAAKLDIAVNHHYAEGEEDALVSAVLAAPSPVLIVWHHGSIAMLVRKIAGERIGCPGRWPDDRFDEVWILERGGAHGGAWSFTEVAQCLLPDDCPNVV